MFKGDREPVQTSCPDAKTTDGMGLSFDVSLSYNPGAGSTKTSQAQESWALRDVADSVHAGSCLAILGPSGAGKTTLLNVLAGKTGRFNGHVCLGGKPTTKMVRAEQISFVEQQDQFLHLLTVGEHMNFHASLRLHALTRDKRAACVTEVLESLKLSDLSDRRIEVLSGGEKKRLSIGEELLNDPQVLILDEPTSQLDSHMAATVVHILQGLASEKFKTIVFTIHQPSSALFNTFEHVLFLSKGRIAYSGSPADLAPFLESIGHACPANFNLAEFTMEQISQEESVTSRICDAAVARETGVKRQIVAHVVATKPVAKIWAPWWVEYFAICRRTFIQRRRQRMQTRLNYLAACLISLIAGSIYFAVGSNQASVRNRTGAIFFLFIHPVFSSIFETSMPLVLDAGTLFREYKNKRLYRISSYYAARTTGELPIQMSFPLIYCVIVYWMVWQAGLDRFLVVLTTLQLACFAGASFGYMLSTFSVDFEISMVISIVFLLTIFLFSGMMVDITALPVFVRPISHASLFKHAFDAGMIAVWKGVDLHCEQGEECLYEDGAAVLRSYNIGANSTGRMARALISLMVLSLAVRLIGFARLWCRYVLEDDVSNLQRRTGVKPSLSSCDSQEELADATDFADAQV